MSEGHTEGPWLLKNFGGVQIFGPKGYAVATMWGALSIEKLNVRDHSNARLIVAACNSYDRHFGPRAIEAAEADLLGKALEALREVVRVADRDTVEFDDARAILSQAREVK